MERIPQDISELDYSVVKDHKRARRAVVVLLCVAVVFIVLAFVFWPESQPVQAVQETVRTVTAPVQAPQPKTDAGLRKENDELRAQRETDKQTISQREQELADANKQVVGKERQIQTMQKNLDTVTAERDDYRDKYTNGAVYWDRMKRAQGWHLSLGGIVSNPLDIGGFTFDPSVTALVGVGPERWQVLTGIGYDKERGMQVSLGFMWTFGDIGEGPKKKK